MLVAVLTLARLFVEAVLQDLQDLPLLLLLAVVEVGLDLQLLFLLLLAGNSTQLLLPLLGPSRIDAAAAPKADQREH